MLWTQQIICRRTHLTRRPKVPPAQLPAGRTAQVAKAAAAAPTGSGSGSTRRRAAAPAAPARQVRGRRPARFVVGVVRVAPLLIRGLGPG